MYTYSVATVSGLLIHISMATPKLCYIIIHDLYTHEFSMKYFTNQESALTFIRLLN